MCVTLEKVVFDLAPCKSMSEARRLIIMSAVKINGVRTTHVYHQLHDGETYNIQIGKNNHRFKVERSQVKPLK